MKLQTKLILILTGVIFISCATDTTEDIYEEDVTSVSYTLSIDETKLLNMVNSTRASYGLEALDANSSAIESATEHTSYMISKGELSHDNWSERAESLGSQENASSLSENVAKHFTPEDAFEAWFNSNKHKDAILGDYNHTGLSIQFDEESGFYYFTQIFMKK